MDVDGGEGRGGEERVKLCSREWGASEDITLFTQVNL